MLWFQPKVVPLAPVLWNTQPTRFGRPIDHSEPGLTIPWREVDDTDAKITLKDSSKNRVCVLTAFSLFSMDVFDRVNSWEFLGAQDNHAFTPPIQVQGENSGEPPCQFMN